MPSHNLSIIMAAPVPLKNPPRSLKNQERRAMFRLDEVPDQFKTRGVIYFGSLHMEKPVLPRGIFNSEFRKHVLFF